MHTWRRNLFLIWLSMLVASMAWMSIGPFLPVFLKDELGVSAASAWAGATSAIGMGLGALAAPFWGAMGDRYGRKAMVLRAGAGLIITYLVLSQSRNVYHVLLSRMVQGMLGGFMPTSIAIVATTTPQAHVGWALGIAQVAPSAGGILGPLVGGLLTDLVGMRSAMLIAALMIATVSFFVLLFVRDNFTPPAARSERPNVILDIRQSLSHPVLPYLLASTILVQAGMNAMEPIMVPFIRTLVGPATPNWVSGAIYALPGFAFVLAAPLWARYGERHGFITTLAIGSSVAGLLVLPQALSFTAWEFGAMRAGQGLAAAAIAPGVAALIATHVASSERGRAFGLNQSANNAGSSIGPLLGGFVGTLAGYRWVLVLSGTLLLVNALWVRRVLTGRLVTQAASAGGQRRPGRPGA